MHSLFVKIISEFEKMFFEIEKNTVSRTLNMWYIYELTLYYKQKQLLIPVFKLQTANINYIHVQFTSKLPMQHN